MAADGIVDPFKPAASPAGNGIVDPFRAPSPAVSAPSAPAATPKLQLPRTWGQAATDLGIGLGEGAVSATMAVPQLLNTATGGAVDRYLWEPVTGAVDRLAGGPGEGRTLAESSQDTRSFLDEHKSPQLRQAEQELADTQGFLPSAKKILTNPMLLGQQVAEQAPQFLVPASAARTVGARVLERAGAEALAKGTAKRVAAGMGAEEAAKLAMPAARRLGERAASKAAGRAVMATGGAIGASQASEQAQQEVMGLDQKVLDANPQYQQLRAQGLSDVDARRELAVTAGMKAAAIALPLDTLASGLTARLEGNIFRGTTGVNGVGQLLSRRGAAGVAKAAGKEGAEETLQEGGEQFAQNVGVQGVDPNKSLMDQVPEQAAIGGTIGAVLGGAGFAGSASLSRPQTHAVPNPGAAPGSLSDAANVLQQPATGPVGRAAQEAVRSGATAAAQAAQAASPTENAAAPAPAPAQAAPAAQAATPGPMPEPGPAPWADPTTGEIRAPSKGQLTLALSDYILDTYLQAGHMRINAQAVADAWGVPKADVNRVRQAATKSATARVAAAEREAMQPAASPAPGFDDIAADIDRTHNAAAERLDQAIAPPENVDATDERIPEPAPAAPAGAGAQAAGATDAQPAAISDGAGGAAAQEPLSGGAADVAGDGAATDTIAPLTTETPNAEAPDQAAATTGPEGQPTGVAGEGGSAAVEPAAEGAAPQTAAESPVARPPAAAQPNQVAEPEPNATRAPKAPRGGSGKAAGGSSPAQAVSRIETVGSKGIRLHGDPEAIRAQLAAGGFKKRGTPQKGALRFDAADRPRIESALAGKPAEQALTAGQKRSQELLGAGVGDTIRTTGMGAEIQPGSTWKIEQIERNGSVHVSSPGGGSGVFTRGQLESEVRKGATFEKATTAPPATGKDSLTVAAPESTEDRQQQIQQGFADNKAAIATHRFKAGDTVTFVANGKTITGTIAKGDKAGMVKDMGIFEVEHPGLNGTARATVGARFLSPAEPVAPAAGEKVATAAQPATFKPSSAARKAESLRVKTSDGEVNGRTHVDQLVQRGFTQLTSTRAGDKLTHALVNAAAESEPIHARQLDYAREATAKAAPAVNDALTTGKAEPTTEESSAVAPDRAALRDTFADAFKKRHPAAAQEMSRAFMDKNADEVIDAVDRKDGRALVSRNLGDAKAMPAARAVFEASTGIKLPKGRRDSEDAIYRWAGSSYEAEQARKAQARADAADKKREPVAEFPAFANYREAEAWVRRRAEAFGGVKKYAQTDEYKRLVPTLRKLAETHNDSVRSNQAAAMAAVGVKEGDTVESGRRGMQTKRGWVEHARGKVFMKDGAPWVRVEGEGTVRQPGQAGNRRAVPWSKEWLPEGKAEAPAPSSTMTDAQFAERLPAYVAQYRELAAKAGNADYFNADLAKELFPEYNASNEARRDNNEKVSSRASKIAFTAFEQRLKQPAEAGEVATLTAGGTGSGKSAMKPDHGIVYDSTMYEPGAAKRNVALVLDSGRDVDYRYVFTDPESAFSAAIARGKDHGRYVNLTAFVRTHEGAYKTVQELMREYADDGRVTFKLYDNTEFAQRKIEALPAHEYNGLREQLQATLDAEYRAGRVSEAEYRAIARTDPPALRDARVTGRARETNAGGRPEQSEGLVTPETPPTGGVSASLASKVEAAASEAAAHPDNGKPEPTQAQKEAGNYEKGHVFVQGLDISIENPRGSTRSGVGENGKPWSHVMTDHYGYIRRTEGADGEQVDVYVGPHPESDHVYVVDQLDQKTGGFDEHKIMLGFDSEAAAVTAYKGNFDKGWKVGPVTAMSMDGFKAWLKEGDTTAPLQQVEAKAAAKIAPAPSTESPNTSTADVGAELWYNRRNRTGNGIRWSDIEGLNATLRAKEAVKSKVWPRPDYEQLVEDGLNPVLAHVVKQVYDTVSAKPRTRGAPTDAQMQEYVTTVGTIRDAAFDFVRDNERVKQLASSVAGALSAELESARGPVAFNQLMSKLDTTMLDAVFPAEDGNRWRGSDQGKANNARALLVGGNNLVRALQVGRNELVKALQARAEGWPAKQAAWQRLYQIKSSSGVFRVLRAGRYVATDLPSREAAEQAAVAHYEQARKKSSTALPSEALSAEKSKREGPARRAPDEDVSSERLMETFGFRGINFGNWMKGDTKAKQRERQLHLNHAYDALADLAELTGLPMRSIGLEGKLGLAFGAQGHGGRNAAHFVPGVNEINLTRTAGAGTIAHEWAHALDHYFAVQAGEQIARLPDPFLTRWSADEKLTAGVRPEIRQAFQKIVNAMKTRPVSAEDLARREARGRQHVADAMNRAFDGLKLYVDSTKLDAAATADFDALAQRLREGDTGEGYVETGTTMKIGRKNVPVTVSQTAGQLLHLLSENGAVKTSDTRLVLANMADIDRLARQVAYMQDAARTPATPTERTDYLNQARKLESEAALKKGEPYWSNNWELFARAFQSYVIDKLASEGQRSDYLSYPQRSEEATKALVQQGIVAGDMWPRGAERERIDAAFDALLGEIKTRETDAGNVALFRRGTSAPAAAAPASTAAQAEHTAKIKAIADELTKTWQGDDVPRVQVVATPEHLPAMAKVNPTNGEPDSSYKSARGMYDGRTVWIVASKHTDDAAGRAVIASTMAHEVVGHYGVDRIITRELGADAWRTVESNFERLRQNGKLGSPAMRSVLDSVERRYRQQDGTPADATTFAREALAVMAERGVKNGLLDRAITALRKFIRKFFPSLKLGDRELRQLLVKSKEFIERGETQQQRVQSRAALAFSSDGATAPDTPAFREFFGDSKVVDADGNPMPVYHGTAEEFDTFDPARSGSTTAHMTANLGTFFAESRAKAQHYAENASQGVPAEERVIDAYLAIRKPYTLSLKRFMGLDSQEESAALRQKLIAEGYDGIHIPEVQQWIAFQPNQIKSASENRGTFDTSTGNIYFSRDDADPDNPAPARRPFGDASASIESMHAELPQLDRTTLQKAKDWIAGKARDFEPVALGALQLRHVLELAADDPTLKQPAKSYGDLYQRMDGDRNQMTQDGAEKVDALQKWARAPGPAGWLKGKIRPEAAALFKFMHAVTQLAVDPTNAYERLLMRDAGNEYKPWTKDLIKERIKVLRKTALSRSGDDKTRIYDEIKELERLPQRERVRQERYPKLVAQWNALSPEAKHHFEVMRDHYQAQSAALEEATIKQLEGLDIPDQAKRQALLSVRDNFRAAKVDGVYFPLSRFGDYWLSLRRKDGEYVFAKYETANEMQQAEKRWLADGAEIEARGRQDNNYRAKDAPSGTFIGDLMGILKNAPDKTKDEIYQMYLKTLPALSLRKHGIHRSNVAGYTDDVPRAFANSVFHGAHQISKARYGWQLQATMEQMRERMEARRTVITGTQAAHGDALLGELNRRHDWIMNPTNNQLANHLTSIGFSYFLAASPASALVNLIQVPQIVLPVLSAQHGWGRTTRVLTATMRDAIRTGGHIDKVLTGEELLAFKALQEQGTFQRSATHALAGISEGDQLRSSPAYAKVMNVLSWMFHTSEVINREGTGMAAFRLAREKGQSFEEAVKYADEMTNGTHGDYSNANRARYMQGNTMKVLTQFKNYSLAMSWLWGRQIHQAFKGESPEVRAVARKTLTGMLGMTGLFAGVVGMPIFNLLRYGAMAAHAVGGDPDEPWDFMTEFRAWLAEHLGETAANLIADGAASELGANVASRVSMSDLWFRDADRQLEGEDAYNAMLQAIAGPLGGLVKNMYVGAQQFNEGHTERGIETMLPTFAKNAVKAVRYASQGVNTLRGDPIVADISAPQALIQAIGFQPTTVARQMRTNNSLYTYQQAILERRQALMNGFAMAVNAGDVSGQREAMQRIQKFNRTNPEVVIGVKNLRNSLRQRARFSAEADNGIRLNKKLAARLREDVGAAASP